MNPSSQQVRLSINGQEYLIEVVDLDSNPVTAVVDGQSYEVHVAWETETAVTAPVITKVAPVARLAPPPTVPVAPAPVGGGITAPMPGDIIDILVKPGDTVQSGQIVCMLEAMKMENAIRSPQAGQVATVAVTRGQAVSFNETLVTFV